MRRLALVIIALLVATSCYAGETYIRDVDGKIVTPVGIGKSFDTAQTNIGISAISLGASTGVCAVYLKPHASNFGMIYIGDSSVTTGTGLEVATNAVTKLDIETINGLYAISAIADQKITVMTIYK